VDTNSWSDNPEERDYLGTQGLDGTIILKYILNRLRKEKTKYVEGYKC
jgi:hypothetical protein